MQFLHGVSPALAVVLLLTACTQSEPDLATLDLTTSLMTYSGGRTRTPWPRFDLLIDTANQALVQRCLAGGTLGELRTDHGNRPQRLDTLVAGNLVTLVDDHCRPAFPVIVGERRRRLAELAGEAATSLLPLVESIVDTLHVVTGGRDDMLFHLLWSRVIDRAWFDAWRLAVRDEEDAPTDVSWVVYPAHAYGVGTNYGFLPGNGHIAMTWSRRFHEHLADQAALALPLHRAAWEQPVPDSTDLGLLRRYGFLEGGTFHAYVYHIGDTVDAVFDDLRRRYAAAAARVVDWTAPPQFGLTRSDDFVIVLHETAYALFAALDRAGSLVFPTVLTEGGRPDAAVRLVSLALGAEPSPKDEAMARLSANHWHGSARVVAALEAVLAQQPDDADLLLYLGMSLYDVADYRRAITVFEQLHALARVPQDLARQRDWAQVWIGHCLDAMGDRDGARRMFRQVVATADSSLTMQFGQYGIGPVSAVEWARERLSTPWRWR